MFLLGTSGDRNRPALVLPDQTEITHRGLSQLCGEVARRFGPPKRLVTVFGSSDLATVLAYLGALTGQHTCALHSATAPADQQHDHLTRYQPDIVAYSPDTGQMAAATSMEYVPAGTLPGGAVAFRRTRPSTQEISGETALLLFTSGSTGSPQAVRLSRANLAANATAIVTVLGIEPDDRAMSSLPFHYCYGLSVLNSHLTAGASVALCGHSPVSTRFWRMASAVGCTSIAGVPTTYRLLHRAGVDVSAVPSLRLMTQAGARLEHHLIRHFATTMERAGGRFIVMYGQTEATARISWLPHELIASQPGSVGRPVPGGRLWIAADHEHDRRALPEGTVGRVMYAGPNVMLGYARSRADLAQGDTMQGVLDTGDRGLLRDGLLYLTGRVARIVKILGRRVDLDDVELAVRNIGPAAVVSTPDERIVVFTEGDAARFRPVRARLARRLRVPPNAIQLAPVPTLPTTPHGKTDYAALRCRVEDGSWIPSTSG